MRKLLFRGIEIANNRMIYSEDIGGTTFWNMWFQGKIKPDTIGQFIDAYDKNNKKIYEGDIVSWNKFSFKVGWSKTECGFRLFSLRDEAIVGKIHKLFGKIDDIVIGNIHENQKLTQQENRND